MLLQSLERRGPLQAVGAAAADHRHQGSSKAEWAWGWMAPTGPREGSAIWGMSRKAMQRPCCMSSWHPHLYSMVNPAWGSGVRPGWGWFTKGWEGAHCTTGSPGTHQKDSQWGLIHIHFQTSQGVIKTWPKLSGGFARTMTRHPSGHCCGYSCQRMLPLCDQGLCC